MQVAMPADAQSAAYRKVVIAENGKGAVGCPQPGDAGRRPPHVAKALVNEVAGQDDQVRLFGQSAIDGVIEIGSAKLGADMQVRQLGDAKSFEGGRQVAD